MRNFKFLILTVILAGFAGGVLVSTPANAQAESKPKLVPIVLNEKTNNPKALEIAKKLDPDFFEIDAEYMDSVKDVKHFARFIPLDSKNERKFIAITTNSPMFCGSMGCPIRFFYNNGGNTWVAVLDIIGQNSWYDENSNRNVRNIVTQNTGYDDKPVSVWLWDGQKYLKVNKKS